MVDNRNVLREIAWRDLFPWLMLVKVFRLAIYPSFLLVALMGVVAMPLGWRLAEALFRVETKQQVVQRLAEKESPTRMEQDFELAHDAYLLRRLPGDNHDMRADVLESLGHPLEAATQRSPLVFVFNRVTWPLHRMFDSQTSLQGYAYYLFGMLWSLAVWAFCGGLITRLAVVQLGREEQADLKRSGELAVKRWFEYFTAPLYPLLGTVFIALLCAPVGWLLLADIGTFAAGILWVFVLLGGAISALLVLWLFIGWPLMYPAISAEETGDAFEAMSRSFAYAFQKPLHYLFYAFVAAVLGFIAWSVVDFFCVLVIDTTHWSVSWGAGSKRVAELWHPAAEAKREFMLRSGMGIIGSLEWVIHALNEAFAYSYFFVAASAIYLLLRLDVDHTEFDEVWSADDVPRYPLPALVPDKAGVPAVAPVAEATPPPSEPTPEEPPIEPNQAE